MTLTSSLAVFIAMIVLALFTGPGVLIVVLRTLTLGLKQLKYGLGGLFIGAGTFLALRN